MARPIEKRRPVDPPYSVLTALARGVLGDGYIPEVPKRMWDLISGAASDADQKQLLGLLRVLDTKAGALLFTGRATPVSWLSPREAEACVQKWKGSRTQLQRLLAALSISASTTSLYAHPGPHRICGSSWRTT